jgi:hypothetical protein
MQSRLCSIKAVLDEVLCSGKTLATKKQRQVVSNVEILDQGG